MKELIKRLAQKNDLLLRLYTLAQGSKTARRLFANYHRSHSQIASKLVQGRRLRGRKALVVGCAGGKSLRRFIRLGAREVHGLDISPQIGLEFQHRKVKYFRDSVEDMHLPDEQYDLVYSMATMEHVHDLESAAREMVRVTKSKGIIYWVAAPLWNSIHGHHCLRLFGHFPWIHLRLCDEEIWDFCSRNNLNDPWEREVKTVVPRMFNRACFNQAPSSKYLDVCRSLKDVHVITNRLEFDVERMLKAEVYSELEEKGFTRQELLARGHIFSGRKA